VAVERHAAECPQCARLLQFWRQVVQNASRDATHGPPEGVGAATKARFGVRATAPAETGLATRLRTLAATLAFDTFEHARPEGGRAGGLAARQLLYEAPPLVIDLQLEAARPALRIRLAGQIVHTEGAPTAGPGAEVQVRDSSGAIVRAEANQFGEFSCEFERRDGLSLSISLRGGERVAIPLDRLPASN
jgi:hypothetical protein